MRAHFIQDPEEFGDAFHAEKFALNRNEDRIGSRESVDGEKTE